MRLTWFGHAAFRLSDANGFSVTTDPYTPEGVGYPPIREASDVVIISSDDDDAHCRADLVPGNPVVINALHVAQQGGTAEADGLTVSAIEAAEWDHHPEHEVPGQNGMYRFELDGLRIAHMGDVGNPLTDAQIAFFEECDVLLALAGGYLTIELPDLMKMIRAVGPKLVVPMHFRTLTYRPRNTMWIESFLGHFDDADVDFACAHTVEIGRSDIPEETRVLVLDYVR
ncbi:MBL fold metallo-hydrolase [Jannaschia aquimarina]|uniref:Metal-dependent hydrolase n=1 Tax=Jannaschia aquimarina TaxID=935700 RepID=A0A0D1EH97_9RHOB|nr:MBL fold metallo-hydrolase [Jannaschia aquimarina]KIT17049.1 metal-dependent hydrolase [Jannaschia aquimarina]SNS82253.1 L-ascorbate metabolism protein UlaG, beta-lactamase superfamily [Jannaschia aquimarina]